MSTELGEDDVRKIAEQETHRILRPFYLLVIALALMAVAARYC